MISVIWVVIVFFIVYRSYFQKGNSDGKGKNLGAPPNINTAPVRHRAENPNRQAYLGTGQDGSVQAQTGQLGNEQEAGENSTMAYLDEKARQDAIEHERDKREEAERLHRNYGGFRVAERLFDGDAVPNGKKCSVCRYCGAENLVPMMSREQYGCYFCREPLS